MRSILLLILVSSLVLGFGAGPVATSLVHSPGQTEEVTLIINNNERKDLRLSLSAEGELARDIEFEQDVIAIGRDIEFLEVKYRIHHPAELRPGTRTAEIHVLELPEERSTVKTMVQATTKVVTKLEVQVPYPGKYAEARLSIDNSGNDIIFNIPVYNFGDSRIENATATIGIYGATYEKIAEIRSDPVSIRPQSEGMLSVFWKQQVNPGTYLAIVTIDYDGKKIRIEQNFAVSNLLLSITDMKVSDFNLGETAIFDIRVGSLWTDEVKGVYGDLEITKNGVQVSKSMTTLADIKPGSEAVLKGYWDTKGAEEGVYLATVTVHYGEKTVKRTASLTVTMNGASLYTAKATEKETFITKETLLTSLVVVLIILVVVLLVRDFAKGSRRPPPPRGI